MQNNSFTIAIVGRPNVGKSSLFNRLTKTHKSIVSEIAGTTRDRVILNTIWNEKELTLIDTGGLAFKGDHFQDSINQQIELAIDVADLVVLVTDFKTGIVEEDLYVVRKLRKYKKPILLVINKFDNTKAEIAENWKKLGIPDIEYISATHGTNVSCIFRFAAKIYFKKEATEDPNFNFCIIGQPNAGKSTLANILLNETRLIVSEIAGTTRDAVDCVFKYEDELYKLTDTAGIRTKQKYAKDIEFYSKVRTKLAIQASQCTLLVIDSTTFVDNKKLEAQDLKIANLVNEYEKPIIIVFSKCDLIDTEQKQLLKQLADLDLHFLRTKNYVFISQNEKNVSEKIFKSISEVKKELAFKFEDTFLKEMLLKAINFNAPRISRGERIEFYSMKQVNREGRLLKFELLVSNSTGIADDYLKYLYNFFYKALNINAIPIIFKFIRK